MAQEGQDRFEPTVFMPNADSMMFRRKNSLSLAKGMVGEMDPRVADAASTEWMKEYSLGYQPSTGAGDPIGSVTGLGGKDKVGGWTQFGEFGLKGAEIGLGIFNALEQRKVNKFMQGYYEDRMAMDKQDFNNSVTAANAAMSGQQARLADALGKGVVGTAANNAAIAGYMDQWGASRLA